MELISNTLVRTFLVLSVLTFSGAIYADDDDNEDKPRGTVELKIETIEFKPTPQLVRNSLVGALLNYNWEIKTVSKNQITAENRHAIIEVQILDDLVVNLVLRGHDNRAAKGKWIGWLKNINKFLNKEFKYHYYIQQFDK